MAKLDKFIIDGTTYEIVPEIAPLFNELDSYSVGDCVIKDAVLYRFTANHTGAWTVNDAEAIEVADRLNKISDSVAPEFDSSASYTAGSYAHKNGVLYRFTQLHTGAWTGTDAVVVTVGEEIIDAKTNIEKEINESLTIPVSGSEIIQGTYNFRGDVSANTARIRTKGIMRMYKGQVIKFTAGTVTKQISLGHRVVGASSFTDGSWLNDGAVISIPEDWDVIIVFRKGESDAITPSDYDAETTILPGFINRFDDEITDIKSRLNRLYNPIKFTTGKCINNGAIASSVDYSLSEYYPVAPGVAFHCITSLGSNTLGISLFNKNKRIIKTYTRSDGTQINPPYGGNYEFNITVPSDLAETPAYFAFTVRNILINDCVFEYTRIIPDLYNQISDLQNAIGTTFDSETITPSSLISGKFIDYRTGNETATDGYSCTGFIDLPFLGEHQISIRGSFYGYVGCAFFNEDLEYISGIGGNNISDYGGTSQRALQTLNLGLPDGAKYIKLSGYGEITASDLWVSGITLSGLTKEMFDLSENVHDINAIVSTTIKNSKVLVIGDSISADAYGSYAKWVTVLKNQGFLPSDTLNSSQHATGFVARYNNQPNDFITRLKAVDTPSQYDLVVVFGGINDYIQNIPMGSESGTDYTVSFKPAVNEFFNYLIENFTQARLCVLLPLRTYATWQNSEEEYQQAYGDYIKQVAKSYCLPILNLTEDSGFFPWKTTFRNMWTLIPEGYEAGDGVHPNQEYESKYLAPMIKHFLQGLL